MTATVKVIGAPVVTTISPQYVSANQDFEVYVGVYSDQHKIKAEDITIRYDKNLF